MTELQKEQIVSFAKTFIGKPYKYGATPEEAPSFFDCSLFTQFVFNHIGITLPRSSILQAGEGNTVLNKNTVEIGDLIFFHGSIGHYNENFPQGIGHVSLFIGDGKVIHASSRRIQEKPHVIEDGMVRIDELSDITPRLSGIVVIKRYE